MRIYIVRHGDPEYSGEKSGDMQKCLTAEGHRQAKALATRFQELLYEAPRATLDSGEWNAAKVQLVTSPLGRARATAQYTEQLLGLAAEVEGWTRELHGWQAPMFNLHAEDGKSSAEIDISAARPGEGGFAAWDVPGQLYREERVCTSTQWVEHKCAPFLRPLRDGYEELVRNSDAFMGKLGLERERLGRGDRAHDEGVYRICEGYDADKQVVVFCHGGFGLTWLAHLLAMPLASVYPAFYLSPSSVTTVLLEQRSNTHVSPRCIGLGDVSHLANAGLPTHIPSKYEARNPALPVARRPSGIKANFW